MKTNPGCSKSQTPAVVATKAVQAARDHVYLYGLLVHPVPGNLVYLIVTAD
jgi:hypothetical protein